SRGRGPESNNLRAASGILGRGDYAALRLPLPKMWRDVRGAPEILGGSADGARRLRRRSPAPAVGSGAAIQGDRLVHHRLRARRQLGGERKIGDEIRERQERNQERDQDRDEVGA